RPAPAHRRPGQGAVLASGRGEPDEDAPRRAARRRSALGPGAPGRAAARRAAPRSAGLGGGGGRRGRRKGGRERGERVTGGRAAGGGTGLLEDRGGGGGGALRRAFAGDTAESEKTRTPVQRAAAAHPAAVTNAAATSPSPKIRARGRRATALWRGTSSAETR